ncbi:MAG TPA: XRE family transcriptional regulator [Phycisphaerae bacterium]|nr:XRE family transcriptional regulator [Phycisphaerae bacterium]
MEALNRKMLVLARESRGLTQSALAEAAEIRQSSISRFENGTIMPDDETLRRLADSLDYPVSFFFQTDDVYGLTSGCLYYRKFKRMPVGELKRIHAIINILRMQVARILSEVEIESDNGFPQLDISRFKYDTDAIARLARASWGMPLGPVENLVDFVEAAGGIVIPVSFGSQSIDAISQWTPMLPPLFFINRDRPGDRIRWTLSHEIGHVLMHRMPSENQEQEADLFASEFLLPTEAIENEFPANVTLQSLIPLKARWKVSLQALIMKAKRLQVISERKAQQLFMAISKHGWRKAEPVIIPRESPTVVDKSVQAILLSSTLEALAQRLNAKPYAVAQLLMASEGPRLRVVK